MSVVSIGEKYEYCPEDCSWIRRVIEFQRNGDDNKSVFASIKEPALEGWKEISRVEGSQISVAMMSTMSKTKALSCLSDFTIHEQDEIVASLFQKGGREVEYTYEFWRLPQYGTVVHLSLLYEN